MSARHADRKDRADTLASRAAALTLLTGAVRNGLAVDSHFGGATAALEARDRAFVRHLVATTLRRLGQIDAVIKAFVTRPPPPPVMDVLRLGAAQILFLETAPHAAVDTAVGLVKRIRQPRLSGLVNAVLRKVAAQGPAMIADHYAARLNTPKWLWDGWVKAYGEKTAGEIAAAHLDEPPLDITVKESVSRETLAAQLDASILTACTLRRTGGGAIQDLPGFSDGGWWVQDAAAALPAQVLLLALGSPAGKAVADLCAAPGGKTLQLAAGGCATTSVDVSDDRLAQVRENLTRTHLTAEVISADILQWTPGTLFDAVLLDAPCSATGTLRRHPDLGYLKSRKDVDRFPSLQRDLLTRAAEFLKPGGVLVYSVCSLEPAEGTEVVDAVAAKAGLQRIPIDASKIGGNPAWQDDAGALRTLPCHMATEGGMDGFYIACLRKMG
jgi:16S rRNA (cytosine967-C5)-methyltransferase